MTARPVEDVLGLARVRDLDPSDDLSSLVEPAAAVRLAPPGPAKAAVLRWLAAAIRALPEPPESLESTDRPEPSDDLKPPSTDAMLQAVAAAFGARIVNLSSRLD